MPGYTKKAIIESFLHIAGKKPLDKVTVRDIVDDCGINRNTFYYHFRDIYAVLEALCTGLLDSIPEEAGFDELLLRFFDGMVDFTARYPRVAHSLSVTIGYDGFERYFGAELHRRTVLCLARETGLSAVELDVPARFARYALFGLLLELGRSGKKNDPARLRDRLALLLPTLPRALAAPVPPAEADDTHGGVRSS